MIYWTFDPANESLQQYEHRLRRQTHAVETIGTPVPASRIEVLVLKARMISSALDKEVLNHLKREYAMSLLEEETEEAALSIKVLEELRMEYGFDPSVVRGRIV